MRLARKNREMVDEEKYRLTVQLTNRELANMIGSSRETLSRTLTRLKKEKVVETDKAGHLIIDYPALEEKVLN